MKTAFIICADPESLLIIILKSHQQLRKIIIQFLVIGYLHIVHLM